MRNVLDLCCKAGGVSRGLQNAGFNVVGIDVEPQPHYPDCFEFYQEDLRRVGARWVRQNFDFVWASPPCQDFTALKNMHPDKQYINLIPDARNLIERAGLPAIIENVVGAPLHNPFMLTGTMFGLGVEYEGTWYQLLRERIFELHGLPPRMAGAVPKDRYDPELPVIGVYGGHARCRSAKHGGRGTKDFEGASQRDLASKAMGIDWMTLADMSQAIPPAYSNWLGEQVMDALDEPRGKRVGI